MTASQRAFLDAADNDIDLFIFVSQQLNYQGLVDSVLASFKKSEPKLTAQVLSSHLTAIREMVFCRYVENVLVYLADVLREVLTKKPAILSSSDRITMERLMKATTLEELIHEAIEDKVSSLSHGGFKDLATWFSERSIPLAEADSQIHEYIGVRNILVHNRGRVDDRFLRTVKNSPWSKGERIFLDTKYIGASAERLGQFVSRSDESIAKKFDLERSPY